MLVQAAGAPTGPWTLPANRTGGRGLNRDLWLGRPETRLAVQSEGSGGQPAGHRAGGRGPRPRWQARGGPRCLTATSRVKSGLRQAGDPAVGIDAVDLHGMARSSWAHNTLQVPPGVLTGSSHHSDMPWGHFAVSV